MTLLDRLKEYSASGALPMHMPGHKRNADAFPWLSELGGGIDITEIDGFDDLNDPHGIFAELEARARTDPCITRRSFRARRRTTLCRSLTASSGYGAPCRRRAWTRRCPSTRTCGSSP